MYEKIYAKLSSFKGMFNNQFEAKMQMSKKLSDEIKKHSSDELEYHFFLTRFYFINFYHAVLWHENLLKMKKNTTCTDTKDGEKTQKASSDWHDICTTLASCPELENINKTLPKLDEKKGEKSKLGESEPSKTNHEEGIIIQKLQDGPRHEIEAEPLRNGPDTQIKEKRIFQKKLFKFLMIKTHPDKTKNKTSQLFIETKIVNQNGYLSILFLLAVSFGYKRKLSNTELELIQYNTAEIIEITESLYKICSKLE